MFLHACLLCLFYSILGIVVITTNHRTFLGQISCCLMQLSLFPALFQCSVQCLTLSNMYLNPVPCYKVNTLFVFADHFPSHVCTTKMYA